MTECHNFKGWKGIGLPDSKHIGIFEPKSEGGRSARMTLGTYVGLPEHAARGFIERSGLAAREGYKLSNNEFVIFESATTIPNPESNGDLLDKRAAMLLAVAHKDDRYFLVTGYAYVWRTLRERRR